VTEGRSIGGAASRSGLFPPVFVLLSLLIATSLVACAKTAPGSPSGASNQTVRPQPPTGQPASGGRPGAGTTTGQGVVVRADGTINPSLYANLTFASGGRILSIDTKQGDRVKKGTELARLDDTSLQAALAQAKTALDQALLAQTQAKLALVTAQFTLDKTPAVSSANDDITDLQWQIKIIQSEMQNGNSDYWSQQLATAQQNLAQKNLFLSTLLGNSQDPDTLAYVAELYDPLTLQDIRSKELQVLSAQQSADQSQDSVDQAQKAFAVAQQQLDAATITAPFDGLVAAVNYANGDIVAAPGPTQRPVIYLIDSTAMELDVAINELDVAKVKVGQAAAVSVDALPGTRLSGRVTSIAPAATLQGGMANYTVSVGLSMSPNVGARTGMNGSAQIGVSGNASLTTPPPSNSPPPNQPPGTGRASPPSAGQVTPSPSRPTPTSPSITQSPSPNRSPSSQTATVKGDGAITATVYANLNFATGGRIQSINVKLGDRVKAGTALVALDTSALQSALAQATVALDQAQLAETQADQGMVATQLALDKTTPLANVETQIADLQFEAKTAQMEMSQQLTGNSNPVFTGIGNMLVSIATQKRYLSTLLAQTQYAGAISYDIVGQKYGTLTLEDMQAKQLQVQAAQQTVDKCQDAVDQAQKSLALAQQQLDAAIIAAPFDGLVAAVNYAQGDTAPPPSPTQRPIIYMVDPSTIELDVSVNELDVPSVKVGQSARVAIDAFPGLNLQGKVISIAPAATITSGIVDYVVGIALSVPANVDAKVGMNGTAWIAAN